MTPMSKRTIDPRAFGCLAERWAIGLLRLPGGAIPYAVSLRDIDADTAWARRVFQQLGIVPGKPLHLIGAGCDNEILWPYENALIAMQVPFGVAEPVAIDAPRTDMFLRRFRMQAVFGLTGELVAALLELRRDLRELLGHSTLVAFPDATARLRAAGLSPWTLVPVGPLWAFESPAQDGARYDEREWRIEADDGELLLTSVAPRATPFLRLRTGVQGRVELRRSEPVIHIEA
jgi:hypothetical protein